MRKCPSDGVIYPTPLLQCIQIQKEMKSSLFLNLSSKIAYL